METDDDGDVESTGQTKAEWERERGHCGKSEREREGQVGGSLLLQKAHCRGKVDIIDLQTLR